MLLLPPRRPLQHCLWAYNPLQPWQPCCLLPPHCLLRLPPALRPVWVLQACYCLLLPNH
jgi:hypothetical protein